MSQNNVLCVCRQLLCLQLIDRSPILYPVRLFTPHAWQFYATCYVSPFTLLITYVRLYLPLMLSVLCN